MARRHIWALNFGSGARPPLLDVPIGLAIRAPGEVAIRDLLPVAFVLGPISTGGQWRGCGEVERRDHLRIHHVYRPVPYLRHYSEAWALRLTSPCVPGRGQVAQAGPIPPRSWGVVDAFLSSVREVKAGPGATAIVEWGDIVDGGHIKVQTKTGLHLIAKPI